VGYEWLALVRIAMANMQTDHIFEAFIEVDENYIDGKPRKPVIFC
jgi:hypothetical protein